MPVGIPRKSTFGDFGETQTNKVRTWNDVLFVYEIFIDPALAQSANVSPRRNIEIWMSKIFDKKLQI